MSTACIGAGVPITSLARLPTPAAVRRGRILWVPTILVVGYHLIALLAFVPCFFSWTGVFLAALGTFLCGSLDISLCYHRLLTHRGFRCPKWFEHALAVLGFCSVQDTPARWVSVHRRHHQHADEHPDPHSPLVSFIWSHLGWILVQNEELDRLAIYERYAKDILRDRFYKRLERNGWQLWIVFLQAAVFFGIGYFAGLALDGTLTAAVQFGASLGTLCTHRYRLAPHVCGQFSHPSLGLPKLRNR